MPIFPITGCRSSQSLLTWLALVSASCLVFSVNLGLQPMPLLLSSELYPPDLRAACKVFTIYYLLPTGVYTLKQKFPAHGNAQMLKIEFTMCQSEVKICLGEGGIQSMKNINSVEISTPGSKIYFEKANHHSCELERCLSWSGCHFPSSN